MLSRLAKLAIAGATSIAIGAAGQRLTVRDATRLSFLSVGQGDCAVFTHAGATILIDAGPRTEHSDAGDRIVIPELRRLGARRIDLLLISHPDADHIGGMPALAKRFGVRKVAAPTHFRQSPAMLHWLEMADVRPGDVLWIGPCAVLHLAKFSVRLESPEYSKWMKDNEGSMFVRIDDGKASAVFSGDAGSDTEVQMESRNESWHSQILKAGHHGSRGSSCESWIRSVSPKWAIVSCGRNNVYGHPSPQVLERLRVANATTLRTDQQGIIEFTEDASGFHLDHPY